MLFALLLKNCAILFSRLLDLPELKVPPMPSLQLQRPDHGAAKLLNENENRRKTWL
jgi:hypothetical protein